MDIRKVKKLIELLEESDVAEIEIHEGEESVRISRVSSAGSSASRQVCSAGSSASRYILVKKNVILFLECKWVVKR